MTTYNTANTNTTTPVRNPAQSIALGRILGAGVLAAVISAILNIVIFLVATSLIPAWNTVNTPMGAPINAVVVAFASVVAALAGTGVFALLTRFVRQPVRAFCILAVVVFVLTLGSPFSLPGAPLSMIAALLLMHTASAVVITLLLTVWTTRTR